MAKDYGLQFGSGDPRLNSGLSPTMIQFFVSATGATLTGPTIIEKLPGSGLYYFSYGTTQAISFTADGGGSLSSTDRYISDVLDPIQAVDQQVGYATDSFGTTGVDPTTIWGMEKRNLEFNEGDAYYAKATGAWSILSRGALGSTTLLRQKTLTNTVTAATKTGV